MSHNSFHKEKTIQSSEYRMFVVYKPGYYSTELSTAMEKGLHHACPGGKKYYNAYPKDKDGSELVRNIAVKHAGHYQLCWMYKNNYAEGDVLRAWDEWGNEISEKQLLHLNFTLKRKNKNRS